jgi:hypothetical protein
VSKQFGLFVGIGVHGRGLAFSCPFPWSRLVWFEGGQGNRFWGWDGVSFGTQLPVPVPRQGQALKTYDQRLKGKGKGNAFGGEWQKRRAEEQTNDAFSSHLTTQSKKEAFDCHARPQLIPLSVLSPPYLAHPEGNCTYS